MKSTNNPQFQMEKSKLERHLAALIAQPLKDFTEKYKIQEIGVMVFTERIEVTTVEDKDRKFIQTNLQVKIQI